MFFKLALLLCPMLAIYSGIQVGTQTTTKNLATVEVVGTRMPWKERKNVKFVRKFGLMCKNPFLLKVLTLSIFQFYGYFIGAGKPGECQPSATLITSTTPTTSITPTSPTTLTTPITSRETNQIPTTMITTTGLWKLGDMGESCDKVCSKIGKKCDLEALHAINDNQKAREWTTARHISVFSLRVNA